MATQPLVTEIAFRDPVAAFAPLAERPLSVLLDSAQTGPQGRFAYIAADPFRTLRCSPYPWRVEVDGRPVSGDAFTILAQELGAFQLESGASPAPFAGGAAGFLSYELGGLLEHVPVPRTTPVAADMAVGLYDVIAAFELEQRRAWVISSGFPETGAAQAARARDRATWLGAALGSDLAPAVTVAVGSPWRAEQTRAAYESKVAAVIESIRAGEIYQANYTQRLTADIPEGVSAFDLYRRLRALAPAPFAAFLNIGEELKILSASPERFLRLDAAGNVETRPIKGTRRRGASPAEDAALAQELAESSKDRSENLMIVDLLRNDIARVCAPGSVAVPKLCGLETFSAVHHLVSVITARLREGMTAVDLLRAAFPGGSITGTPKIRAMEIIHELEPSARGPYCGTIAWLGFDGAMDSSIVIRTLVQTGRTLAAQAGGGIVAQSDPAAEYDESMIKLRPLLAVLGNEPRI